MFSLGLSKDACMDFLRKQVEDTSLSKGGSTNPSFFHLILVHSCNYPVVDAYSLSFPNNSEKMKELARNLLGSRFCFVSSFCTVAMFVLGMVVLFQILWAIKFTFCSRS